MSAAERADRIQFQASDTMSSSAGFSGTQPSAWRILSLEATRMAGSPSTVLAHSRLGNACSNATGVVVPLLGYGTAPLGKEHISRGHAERCLNHAIDKGFYPLGSCTMKYNPKVNEDVSRLTQQAEERGIRVVLFRRALD